MQTCVFQFLDIATSFHDGYFAVVSRLFVVFSLSCRSLCEVTKCHKRIQFEVELAYASVFINVKSPTCAPHSRTGGWRSLRFALFRDALRYVSRNHRSYQLACCRSVDVGIDVDIALHFTIVPPPDRPKYIFKLEITIQRNKISWDFFTLCDPSKRLRWSVEKRTVHFWCCINIWEF